MMMTMLLVNWLLTNNQCGDFVVKDDHNPYHYYFIYLSTFLVTFADFHESNRRYLTTFILLTLKGTQRKLQPFI